MKKVDIGPIVESRLRDIAAQTKIHWEQGMYEEYELLRQEGLDLAREYDNGATFLYLYEVAQ